MFGSKYIVAAVTYLLLGNHVGGGTLPIQWMASHYMINDLLRTRLKRRGERAISATCIGSVLAIHIIGLANHHLLTV